MLIILWNSNRIGAALLLENVNRKVEIEFLRRKMATGFSRRCHSFKHLVLQLHALGPWSFMLYRVYGYLLTLKALTCLQKSNCVKSND